VTLALPDSDIAPVTFSAAVDTQSNDYKGKVSEAAFAYQAVLRGWDVIDAGGAADYDRVIKRPTTRGILVQVKRAYRDEARSLYVVNCSRSRRDARGRSQYSATAFDVLAVHLPDIDQWVFYTRPELGDRTTTTFILPGDRRNKTSCRACTPRNPNNWTLIDQVAAMYSQESLGLGQPMSDPMSDSPCISQ
jgi:hypothetical protein